MRGRRTAASRCAAAVVFTLGSAAAASAPYRPQDDSVVLERIPPGASAAVLERARRSGDVLVALRLARSFIERARSAGDPRLLGYAQGLLQPWAERAEVPGDVLLLRATIRQSLHDFDGALADLDRVLAGDPGSAQGWLTRATVLRVQGNYVQALEACSRLAVLAPGALGGELCIAGIRSLRGDLRGSLERVRALAPLAQREGPQVHAWFQSELADQLDRAGEGEAAGHAYRTALRLAPDDTLLASAYADHLLDAKRNAEVLEFLAGRSGEALSLRRLIAQRRTGNVDAAELQALAQAHAAARRRGDGTHEREEARFELEVRDDAARALELALHNWSVQREPADTRLVIASAIAAGRPQAAASVAAWWRQQGSEDIHVDALLEQLR